VVLDRTGTLQGRGAYLCRVAAGQDPVAECLARAIRRNGLARALRSRVSIDPELVESLPNA
jgi:predicted RNA-binding protein YlxR (DUF448 family)